MSECDNEFTLYKNLFLNSYILGINVSTITVINRRKIKQIGLSHSSFD